MGYLLIQAAADRAGVSAGTARAYFRQGLVRPLRDNTGRRLFTESDILRIREIYLANMAKRPVPARRSPEQVLV